MPVVGQGVTVCVTAYNQGRYVAQAIESVLTQTCRPAEVFVLDDASTDDTPSVTQRYVGDVTVIRNSRNLGLVGNWNRAVTLGSAPYLAILHGDDLYLPGMLARASQLLDSNPAIGFAYTAYYHVDQHGRRLDLCRPFSHDHIWPGEREFRHHVRHDYVQCPTVVVRRQCYHRLGAFDPRLMYAVDWEMWLRIESHGYHIGYAAEPLACWRLHPLSTSRNLERQGVSLVEDDIAALEVAFHGLPPAQRSLAGLRDFAFCELTRKYLRAALVHAARRQWAMARTRMSNAVNAYRHHPGAARLVLHLCNESSRFIFRKRWQDDR